MDKRAAMLNVIDMRRGSSAVSQQVQKMNVSALACLHTTCKSGMCELLYKQAVH